MNVDVHGMSTMTMADLDSSISLSLSIILTTFILSLNLIYRPPRVNQLFLLHINRTAVLFSNPSFLIVKLFEDAAKNSREAAVETRHQSSG